MYKICVVGSINMDLAVNVKHFPKPGETVLGSAFNTFYGGKGANQAVAAKKLGGKVALVGCLGNDAFGQQYLEELNRLHVDNSMIYRTIELPTGIAMIEVSQAGENCIVIVPGANACLTQTYLESILDRIMEYDIFLFQMEIPLLSNQFLIQKLKHAGKMVIFDPAPAEPLPEEVLSCVDYLTPNETEIEILSGLRITTEEELKCAARALVDKGVNTVIVKAGSRGVYVIDSNTMEHFPAFKVDVVDTTAAGDSFNGGFAYALSRELPFEAAINYANAVGALSVTGLGAQGAMPEHATVARLLELS